MCKFVCQQLATYSYSLNNCTINKRAALLKYIWCKPQRNNGNNNRIIVYEKSVVQTSKRIKSRYARINSHTTVFIKTHSDIHHRVRS